MKAAQIKEAGSNFEIVDIEKPSPQPNQILIKVEACGVCHSDMFTKEGAFPGIDYPRVPGHEVVGTIEEVGSQVNNWKIGDRAGVGWHGGHCFECSSCKHGDFINCENAQVCGISYDGGYAEYVCVPKEAVAGVPDALKSTDAAPLLCAGITVFNAMRNSSAKAGDTVAIQGIGGLGHLAIQYANKMGFRTVAISTSNDKKQLAKDLGAHHFINAKEQDATEELQNLGGADLILATAPNSKAITSVVKGLSRNGQVLVVAATGDMVEVSPLDILMGRKSIAGWPSGTATDSEETLDFSALFSTLPMIETYKLADAQKAYDRMMNNEARFRVVLEM